MTQAARAGGGGAQALAVSFKPYAPGDIPACARLARDAWPAGRETGFQGSELAGMEGYMRYSLGSSNWTDMAVAEDGLVGFLFGRIDGLPGTPVPETSALGELPSLARTFLARERVTPNLLRLFWSLVMTDVKLALNTPRSDAAVEMLIVDSAHRGKGVGGMLLDRFLRAAEASGSRLVTVYTDELMSDWQFYEHSGFRRVATFHDDITSHYAGSPSRGFVFALDLGAQRGAGGVNAGTSGSD